jgi:hypothetical protein
MKKLLLIFSLLLAVLLGRAQDTLYVNQVLPDSIEIYDANYEYINYVLIVSEYRDSSATYLQTRTVRLRIYPDRVVKVDDKVYYRISKKDKKL